MDQEVTGRAIIEHLQNAITEHQHPLVYSTLVPSLYIVYLRPEDYDRLESLFPKIKEEARRALDEKLGALNGSRIRRLQRKPECVNLMGEWYIEFQADTGEEEIPPGEPFAVNLEIALSSEPEYGVGTKTVSLKTVRMSNGQSKQVNSSHGQIYARIAYTDESGQQTYLMTKKQIVVGRGGREHWADLELKTIDDVSRNHFRLRYDEGTNGFFIKDISSFGTTINGNRVPSSLEVVEGSPREIDVEVPLPLTARITLADKVDLDFKAETAK